MTRRIIVKRDRPIGIRRLTPKAAELIRLWPGLTERSAEWYAGELSLEEARADMARRVGKEKA